MPWAEEAMGGDLGVRWRMDVGFALPFGAVEAMVGIECVGRGARRADG